jgi:hypothetical protein
MHALEITWEIFFCFFFFSFFQIFCVKRQDGVFWNVKMVLLFVWTVVLAVRTVRLICLDIHSSCPDGHFLQSPTWHSVRTVNPVGLNRILPSVTRHFLLSFGSFCRLVHFFCTFYAYFLSARVIFAIYLHPMYVFILFY